ncbi:MAG: Ig-like domain-containing protein [Deltaproteobacteria bacterium]|nr:Ig-like domain-containing protein [Deltaproteobacteria bacterium]
MSLRQAIGNVSIASLCLLGGCTLTADEDLFGVHDQIAPQVVQTLPGDDWIQVPLGIELKIWFSEPVEPNSVYVESLHLYTGQDLMQADYLVSQTENGCGLVVLRPDSLLVPGVCYHLKITSLITDLFGNPLEEDKQVIFTTMR